METPLNEEVRALRQVPLFAGVSPNRLKLLAFSSERVSYRPGDALCLQGDVGDAAFVILSGRAEVLVDSPKGQSRVAEVADNAVVGEIAILCETPRTATVKATTQVEALRIGKENFVKLMTDFPETTIEVMRVLAERLTRTTAELAAARARLDLAKN